MRCTSKVFIAEFKVKVALKALVGRKTVNEIAGTYKVVHPHQVVTRKRKAQEGLKACYLSAGRAGSDSRQI